MDKTRVKVYVGEEEKTDVTGRGAICIVFRENEEGEPKGLVSAQSIVIGKICINDIVMHLTEMNKVFETDDGNFLAKALTRFLAQKCLEKAGDSNGD